MIKGVGRRDGGIYIGAESMSPTSNHEFLQSELCADSADCPDSR